MYNIQATEEVSLLEKQCVQKTIMTPKQIAAGNDNITILKHRIFEKDDKRDGIFQVGIELAIRNISEKTIATVIFEAQFYGIDGNILDIAKHKELDLKSNTSRTIFIQSSITQPSKIKGYDVKIIKITTVDFEPVQICRNEIRTIETGEEIMGIVRNISKIKTDIALIATFKDFKDEKIGIRVIPIKDIEPGEIRKFHFIFIPPEGDKVKTYALVIGEIIKQ